MYSIACAAQPTMRAIAKIGVKRSVGIPKVWKTIPEYESTFGKIGVPAKCFRALCSMATAVSNNFVCPFLGREFSSESLEDHVPRIPGLVDSMPKTHDPLLLGECLDNVSFGFGRITYFQYVLQGGFISAPV